jgi:uncharacterized protein (DUF2384 family)
MGSRLPLDEEQIVLRLLRTKSIEEAARWMVTPNPELQDATPDAAVEAGRGVDVLRIIERLEVCSDLPSSAE